MDTVRAPIVLVAILSGAITAPALAATPYVETFDTDEAGFQGSTISTVQIYAPAGGNPGGHVVIRKDLSPPAFDIGTENMSTPEFVGNYAITNITGAGFDIRPDTAFDEVWLRFRDNVGVNGWHYDIGALPGDATWRSFDIPLDPTWSDGDATGAGWVQEAGAPSWADTFASVGWIEVRTINDTSALAGIDNVRLVPSPGIAALPLLVVGAGLRRRR